MAGARRFDLYIGIDYSGAELPTKRLAGLQVYMANGDDRPAAAAPPTSASEKMCWSRKLICRWLIEQCRNKPRFVAGIDHAFSFPWSYFEKYELDTWDRFLEDFRQHWPTHEQSVKAVRQRGPERTGNSEEFRLTDRWTSSAKSVFQFDVPGQVAPSTHAGLPWLLNIRQAVRAMSGKLHFWPFDGWCIPEGYSVIAEVYPSIFHNRYSREKRPLSHQQDAYATARWLSEADDHGFLDRYLHPPLTEGEKKMAKREGWILGVA